MTAKTSELLLQFNEYATAHDKAFERALVKHPNAKTFVIATTKDPCVFVCAETSNAFCGRLYDYWDD